MPTWIQRVTLHSWQKYVCNNVTVWFQWHLHWRVWDPQQCGSRSILSPAQYLSKAKGCGGRRKPPTNSYLHGLEPSWDYCRKSVTWHPSCLTNQFKNICYHSGPAVISPSFANWLCIASSVIFPLFTTLGLSVFWTNDNMLYWKTNCLKTELESKLFRATEKGFCASDAFN